MTRDTNSTKDELNESQEETIIIATEIFQNVKLSSLSNKIIDKTRAMPGFEKYKKCCLNKEEK